MTPLLSVLVLAVGTFITPPDFSAPALCSSAPAPVEMAKPGSGVKAMCIAHCGTYPDVSCSGTTCSAADRSCSAERGHVTCGTTTIYCPVCPCTEGQSKTVIAGPTCGCEGGLSTLRDHYQCIGGEWVYQSSYCGAPFCTG
jgi:hypothetical protein